MDKETPIESLETWLSNKPYWEQYVWKRKHDNEITDTFSVYFCIHYDDRSNIMKMFSLIWLS